MAKAAYDEYAEADGTPVIDFALDVLLFAQSEHPRDTTILARLAYQAGQEWAKSKRVSSSRASTRRKHTRGRRHGR
jgi:hypothetical protein